MMGSTEQQFRTDNMVLATLLRMEGHEYRLECQYTTRGGKQAVWVFGEDDGVQTIVDDFDAEEHCVEPRQFAIAWGEVRSEMYAFLDGNSNSRRDGNR